MLFKMLYNTIPSQDVTADIVYAGSGIFNPKARTSRGVTKGFSCGVCIGKMLVPLGWYPSCLTPQGAL